MSMVYFASDFHLGIDARLTSHERERQIVRWLDLISNDADTIFLVGDLFDFWFEYKSVVPRGFVRLLGKLAELSDRGINIEVFTGNHDMWMFSFFEDELGIPVHREPIIREINGVKFFIAHGDGLGPNDFGYKFIKKVFANPLSQWLFARLHPNFAFSLARYWSSKSRETAERKDQLLGREKEWLVEYANKKLDQMHIDYFIFGHRHIPINCLLDNGTSIYVNLGDWLYYNSFASFDGRVVKIQFFENDGASAREL